MARKLKEMQSAVIDWFCPSCGKDVSMEDVKCPHCGAKFVPIGSISEEEKRLQELQDKIVESTTKKKEDKKEKAEKKKDVSSEEAAEEAAEKPKRRKAVDKPVEKVVDKADAIAVGGYAPRPGTRKAFILNALVQGGIKPDDFIPKYMKEFNLDDATARSSMKTVLTDFRKAKGLPVVEENGLWKLSS